MYELYLNNPREMLLKKMSPLPQPQHDEVKVKVIYGGICGSDLRVFEGKVPYATYPVRPGHELIGTIIEKGPNANFSIGDRVIVVPNTFCDECNMCTKGYRNICRHKKSLGINLDGGFSQEFMISSKYLLSVPDEITDEKAVLIEPLAVIVHAFKKVKIDKDSRVAIIGCGNEGLLATLYAAYMGAEVTVIDINPRKKELAKQINDNITFLYPQDVTDEKFDVVIESAGVKNAVEQAFKLVNSSGSLVIIGLAKEANIPVVDIVRNEINVFGSVIYHFPDDYLDTINLLSDPKFKAEKVISKIMHFKEYEKAYKYAKSGDYGKIILNFKEEIN